MKERNCESEERKWTKFKTESTKQAHKSRYKKIFIIIGLPHSFINEIFSNFKNIIVNETVNTYKK